MSTGFIEPIGAEVFTADEVFVDQDAQPAQLAPVAHPAAATPVKATADTGPITSITQLPSVWKLEAKIEWLMEELIPLGSITLLAAESGTGKTWLAYAIAGAVAHGQAFAGFNVKQRPVLYLDGENSLGLVKSRLLDLGVVETPNLHIWGGWNSEHPHGPNSIMLREFVRREKPLLIWDSMVEFHPGDEQSATETRAFMKQFRVLTNLGATVLILHHTGKVKSAKEYRGSSDIKGAVDTAYVVKSPLTETRKLTCLTLENFKSRFAPGRDVGLEFQLRQGFRRWEPPKNPRRETAEDVIRAILTDHASINGKRIKELAKGRMGKNKIDAALQNGTWQRATGTANETLYSLPTDFQNPEIPTPKREGNQEIEPLPAEEVA